VPKKLERIIKRALTKSTRDRYESAEDLKKDLKSLGETVGSVTLGKKISAQESKPSIAVLPFRDMSPQKDQEYFCDGIAEELINALVKLEGLRVAARTSAFQFKDRDSDIKEIGEQLEVKTILEGSVRKSGNRLRITAQLINIEDGFHLWSEKYDRDLKDIFAIQDEISLAIVDVLKVKLLGDEKAKLVKKHTADQQAYNLYLQGRYFWSRRFEGGLQKAIDYFQQSIVKDSGYAHPYVGIADCFNILAYFGFMPPMDGFPKAKAAAMKALEIDGSLGEAHASLGWIKTFFEWDFTAAEMEFQRAFSLNPKYATAHEWYALLLAVLGKFDEALAEATSYALGVLGANYGLSGQRRKALEVVTQFETLSREMYISPVHKSYPYMGLDMTDEVFDLLDHAIGVRDSFLVWLKVSPDMDKHRTDPRFTEILRKIGLEE
jgi:TolB-like protein